ncbi:hypothetical protein AAVH_36008 [Aphelenchoides avenae]|nr:hypothetical protein AAVH_36008 [Aphelenchus avenae]
MPSINRLLRRLSVRATKLRKDTTAEVAKICSRKSSTSTTPHGDIPSLAATSSASLAPHGKQQLLPDKTFFRCLDYIDDPFALCKLRGINGPTKEYVECRLSKVVEMDVRKVKFDTISSASFGSTCTEASDSSHCAAHAPPTNQFHFENKLW